MKLYLAGNFTITDNVEKEKGLKKRLGKNYNRLCTYFYPKDADVVIKGEKNNAIKKEIEIKEEDQETKKHKALTKRKIRIRKR